MLRRFFELRSRRVDRATSAGVGRAHVQLARPVVIAFAVVVGYPYIPGSGSEAFKGVSLFLGIIFSLGSSSFIANTIAGYSMTYRRAFSSATSCRSAR